MKKLAVITGATKGIGRAIVQRFAQEGFDIVGCSRSEADLLILKEVIESQYDVRVHISPTDMSDKDEVVAFGTFIRNLPGQVEVLVNNAGVFIPGKIIDEKDGALEQMIETNLYSAYHLTRTLVDDLISQQKGHIFNMCSTASIMPYENGGSYCISKYALLGMTKVLREEMKSHNIKVTAILPGATYTASWEGVDLPEDRFMKADDVANAIWGAYTMSDSTVIEEILMRPQLGDL
jgi:short-subunit dehydrogenase